MEQQPGRRDPVDPSQYDLLGFVLGALDAQEHARVSAAVEQHPELRDAVDRLYATLPKTDDTWGSHRPPAGLARRTCERLADFDHSRQVLAQLPPVTRMTKTGVTAANSSWSWRDLVIGAAACLALALMLLPAILNSRHQARIRICQGNLRQVSFALQHYADMFSGRLPFGLADTPLGVAGAFGPILKDAALIEDSNLICPSSELANRCDFYVPSCDEVMQAKGATLSQMQLTMGGTYAYTLGHIENNKWHSPTSQQRPWTMVVADSNNPTNPTNSRSHGKMGQNVVFEDGHICFLSNCSPHLLGDDSIYVNRYGIVAAGVDADDTVLGSSFAKPFATPVEFSGN